MRFTAVLLGLLVSCALAEDVIVDPAPAKQTEPVNPAVDPVNPTDPVNPIDPSNQTDPAYPTDPEFPTDPVVPEPPATNETEPVTPVQPTKKNHTEVTI